MATYKDLSRRALIQLNQDFDSENENALKHYLDDHDGEYEKERFSEKVIDKCDSIASTFGGCGSLLGTIAKKGASAIANNIISTITGISDDADLSLKEAARQLELGIEELEAEEASANG